MKAGIYVISSNRVFESQNIALNHNRARVIYEGKGYKLGNFKVTAFNLFHDVPILGYLINHPACGNTLFITDTYMVEHQFKDINNVMLEVNYEDSILENNIINGRLNPSMRPRLLYTHLELETAKNILRSLDLSNVVNIVLLHLSAGNSNEARFVKEISEEFCINTIAADREIEIPFNLEPY